MISFLLLYIFIMQVYLLFIFPLHLLYYFIIQVCLLYFSPSWTRPFCEFIFFYKKTYKAKFATIQQVYYIKNSVFDKFYKIVLIYYRGLFFFFFLRKESYSISFIIIDSIHCGITDVVSKVSIYISSPQGLVQYSKPILM